MTMAKASLHTVREMAIVNHSCNLLFLKKTFMDRKCKIIGNIMLDDGLLRSGDTQDTTEDILRIFQSDNGVYDVAGLKFSC